ncbi:alpha/beta hydrolase [Paracoccaceae bacterium Fryx2]|nr:alpha/beta hydrolase [Paracoccaceae bacterium Fryx2]
MAIQREPGLSHEERAPRTGGFVSVWGNSFHVLSRGSGAPFVLLHGNGSLGEEILSAFPDVAGVRWIAPDRPGYGQSDPLPDGHQDPLSQAAWLDALLTELGIGRATFVAHSLAAGAALAFASVRPGRTARLVLLAPFCRPTPEKPMPALRIATAPVVGSFVRRILVPPLVRRMRQSIISGFMAPNRVPPWLRRFPVTHAARPRSVATMAAELKSFNDGMRDIGPSLRVQLPVTVVHGLCDQTAQPEWHLPWLRQQVPHLTCVLVPECGHAVHHAAPGIVLRAVLDASADSTARRAEAFRQPDPVKETSRDARKDQPASPTVA